MKQERQGSGAGSERVAGREGRILVPGEPMVDLICAEGVFEPLLEAIAHPVHQPRHRRIFGRWHGDLCEGKVLVGSREVYFSLHRLNGDELPRGPKVLVIRESSNGRLSMKPVVCDSAGTLALHLSVRHCETRWSGLASQLVSLFLVHGRGWRDSSGNFFPEPYGPKPNGTPKKRNRKPRRRHRHGSFIR